MRQPTDSILYDPPTDRYMLRIDGRWQTGLNERQAWGMLLDLMDSHESIRAIAEARAQALSVKTADVSYLPDARARRWRVLGMGCDSIPQTEATTRFLLRSLNLDRQEIDNIMRAAIICAAIEREYANAVEE